MTSSYLMVRSGLCPYVYVCCHHMTVMFSAAGVARSQIHAVLTPTTRGIRAALDADGKTKSLLFLTLQICIFNYQYLIPAVSVCCKDCAVQL